MVHEHVGVYDFVKFKVVVFFDRLFCFLVELYSIKAEEQDVGWSDHPGFTEALLAFLFVDEALYIILERFVPRFVNSIILDVKVDRA